MKVFIYLFQLLLLSLCLSACKNDFSQMPDFTVSRPLCRNREISFDFYNKSESEVKAIQIKMNVFDKETGLPALKGAVTLVCSFDCEIPSFRKELFSFSLSDYLENDGNKELIIDNFYVSRITFANGKEWKDMFGFYLNRGNYYE